MIGSEVEWWKKWNEMEVRWRVKLKAVVEWHGIVSMAYKLILLLLLASKTASFTEHPKNL